MANLADILVIGGKVLRGLGEVQGLRDPGDQGEIPVIKVRIGKVKLALGPIPVKVVE